MYLQSIILHSHRTVKFITSLPLTALFNAHLVSTVFLLLLAASVHINNMALKYENPNFCIARIINHNAKHCISVNLTVYMLLIALHVVQEKKERSFFS